VAAASYRSRTITSSHDLLEDLLKEFTDTTTLWYRGHARATWSLLPSLARRKGLDKERALRAEFMRDATPLLSKADVRWDIQSDWDWMFLMQHYHVPTRLLDWSESPLIGLYFALDETDVTEPEADACLWVLLPQKLNALRGVRPKADWILPLCGRDEDAEQYTLEALNQGADRVLTPLAVIAQRRFDRLVSQQGVFTVMHRDEDPIEDLGTGQHVSKYVIPVAAKDQIRRELARLNISPLTVFPDLQRVGKRVAARLS
jgi:hypothetical protein